jgi:hypothetical protein
MLDSNVHATREQLSSVQRGAALLHATLHAIPSQVGDWRSSPGGHLTHAAPQLSTESWTVQDDGPPSVSGPSMVASICASETFLTLPHPRTHIAHKNLFIIWIGDAERTPHAKNISCRRNSSIRTVIVDFSVNRGHRIASRAFPALDSVTEPR